MLHFDCGYSFVLGWEGLNQQTKPSHVLCCFTFYYFFISFCFFHSNLRKATSAKGTVKNIQHHHCYSFLHLYYHYYRQINGLQPHLSFTATLKLPVACTIFLIRLNPSVLLFAQSIFADHLQQPTYRTCN